MNRSNRRHFILNSAAIVFGNALYSLAVALFLEPAGLITGGATGIALAFGRLTGLSVSGFLLAFNIAMLVWGWVVLGRAFASARPSAWSSGPGLPPAAWTSRRWCCKSGSGSRSPLP